MQKFNLNRSRIEHRLILHTGGKRAASGYRGGCSACASRLALIGEYGTYRNKLFAFAKTPIPFKTFVPLFLFERSAKEKANIKSFGKGWGVPPSLKLRRTRQGKGGSGAQRQPTTWQRHDAAKVFPSPLPAGLRNKAGKRRLG